VKAAGVMCFSAVVVAGAANAQIASLSGFGAPLKEIITSAHQGDTGDLQIFTNGQINFKEVETIAPSSGLGPLFNNVSCAACHDHPAMGGNGLFISEIHVRNNPTNTPVQIFAVDNMLRLGPQMQGNEQIFPTGVASAILGCQITSANCQWSECQKELAERTSFSRQLPLCNTAGQAFANGENCTAERQSLFLFGDGLVEATSNDAFQNIAANQPPEIRGTIKWLNELGMMRVARFGWKDDHATLRGFASDAYLNEIGITNPDNPTPNSTCASSVTQFGIPLQVLDDPEDTVDSTGRADIDRFADFMRALAPPSQLPQDDSAQAGAQLFNSIGCAGCHVPSITTSSNPASFVPPTVNGTPISSTLNTALANQTYHPYSDFLLHDMGSLGDGITAGVAGPTMMRTPPLWGVRAKAVFLHDGRATSLPMAITLHDGQGKTAAQAFQNLSSEQQQQLIDFLNTL
jgi:CxxC motif-containing protein (DUF1111 family)